MIVIILTILVTFIITFIICYYLPKEKVKKVNQELEKQEQQLRLNIKDAEKEYLELTKQQEIETQRKRQIWLDEISNFEKERSNKNLSFLQAEMKLKEDIASLETEIEEKKKSFSELDAQAKEAIQSVEEQVSNNMSNSIEQQGKELIRRYEKLESELLLHYTELADDKWNEYIAQSEKLNTQLLAQENKLEEARNKAQAIVESNRKAELSREEKDFYKLQLSDLDIEEIQKIRSIEPYLRQKEPLNKVIWKVYYEKPFTDLIGRVVGTKKVTGIYKITHIDSGKTYVGQAVDIAERWRQHIKRGVGADPPTTNKLYPAMLQYGAENFMFEILEECPSTKLSEREKYYTDVYESNNFGYVVRKG